MPLSWSDGAYRDGDDALTEAEVTERRDQQIDAWADELASIASEELGGGETVATIEFPTGRIEAFAARFLARAGEVVTDAYVWAAGGVERVTAAGWRTVAELVDRQATYGRGFVSALRGGGLSEPQATARARLYAHAATNAFEAGRADQLGLELPAMPGDGSQDCLTQCKCSWSIVEFDDRWEATWSVNASAEHCPTCLANAEKWAPFTQDKETGQ